VEVEVAVHAAQESLLRDFRTHLLAYLLVGGFLWLVWGVVYAAADGPWFPWPLFPLGGWAIGLVFHAWDVYGRKPFSEAAVEREIARLRTGRGEPIRDA
jgi:2TM domain